VACEAECQLLRRGLRGDYRDGPAAPKTAKEGGAGTFFKGTPSPSICLQSIPFISFSSGLPILRPDESDPNREECCTLLRSYLHCSDWAITPTPRVIAQQQLLKSRGGLTVEGPSQGMVRPGTRKTVARGAIPHPFAMKLQKDGAPAVVAE